MDDASNDEELLRSARAGDRGSFEELVRRTARYLYAHIYVQTGDPELAQDLVQETYLAGWRQIAQVRRAHAFRAWLAIIADRAVIDHRRRAGRKKRFFLRRAADEEPAARESTPVADAQKTEERQRALESLRSLPESYRVPLMLRYLQGADYEAISSQLGLSNGSLRGLLHRGLAMLRERLGEEPQRKDERQKTKDERGVE